MWHNKFIYRKKSKTEKVEGLACSNRHLIILLLTNSVTFIFLAYLVYYAKKKTKMIAQNCVTGYFVRVI